LKIAAALLATGAATLIWQVASARAVMAALRGSELTLGLVLASWLLLTGGATAVAARALGASAREAARPTWLTATLLLCPASLLASLLLLRAATAGPLIDAAAGPGMALAVTLLCLAPPCLLLGGAFGLISLGAPGDATAARWAGKVFLLESLGTVAAGVVFHLALAPLPLGFHGLAAGTAPWLVGLLFLAHRRHEQGSKIVPAGCAVAGALALILMSPWGMPLGAAAPPGYQVLEQRNSRHGALSVLARGGQRIFLQNGLPLFTSQDRPLVQGDLHITLLAHPRPGRVLLVGGGLGGGLGEVLRHGASVERVDYVELDPELVTLTRQLGAPAQRAALDDARLHLVPGDGRRWVAASPATYDVIMVALPGPTSALINRFYTAQFMAAARRALRPGGLLRVTLTGSDTYLGDEQALLHATVLATLERAFPGAVLPLPGQTTLLLAGKDEAPRLDRAELSRRLAARALPEGRLELVQVVARTLPFKREQYRTRLSGLSPPPNTDLVPAAYFQATLHWLAATSPAMARGLDHLGRRSSGRGWIAAAAALPLALLLALLLRRVGRSPAGVALAMAGMAGISLQLSLLLFCQEERGVIYHEVGALVTAFMAGMAAGAHAGALLVRRWPARALNLSLAGCAAAALIVMAMMLSTVTAGGGDSPLSLSPFLAVTALVGMAVGACYAPAAAVLTRNKTMTSGPATAYAYAWDLAGAAAGALVASVFLLPVLGLPQTSLLCAALCGGFAAGMKT